MLFTLEKAREQLSRFVETGTCDSTILDQRINEAVERLLDMQDWEFRRQLVRCQCIDRCITLPQTVEKVLWADIDGVPAKIFGQAYQFLSSGPGDLDYRNNNSGFKDLVDCGDGFPTCFEFAGNLPLAAFSVNAPEAGETVTVWGAKPNGEDIKAEIAVQQWYEGIEGQVEGPLADLSNVSDEFAYIRRVEKTATSGYVTLYGIDAPNYGFHFLGRYTPAEGIASFRRYKVTNAPSGATQLLALVRLRFADLTDAEDIVPVPSMQALKLMLMALREENVMNMQGAAAYEGKARDVLEKRQASGLTRSGSPPTIINVDYRTSLGRYARYRPL